MTELAGAARRRPSSATGEAVRALLSAAAVVRAVDAHHPRAPPSVGTHSRARAGRSGWH